MREIKIIIALLTIFYFPLKTNGQNKEKEKKKTVHIITIDDNNETTTIGFSNTKIHFDEHNDTITTITLGHKQFEFIDKGNRTNIRMVYLPRESFKGHFAGVNLGFCNYLGSGHSTELSDDASFMELNSGKSMSFGINFLQYDIGLQKYKKSLGLVTGIGWTVYNYRLDSQYLITKDENNNTVGYPVTDKTIRKNKIVCSYIQIPLLFEAQIPSETKRSKAHISAGVYGGFKIGSHTKTVYEGKDKNKSRDNINLNPFQYGFMCQLGFNIIKLYATYNLSPLFERNNGPELYPFSVGLTLLTF